jgi:glycosyltransferase involved in cell wall biosynthesis
VARRAASDDVAGTPGRDRPRVVAVFGMSFHPAQGRYLRVHNQLRALAAAGYDVLLLCWDREGGQPEEEARDGFRIRRIRIPAGVGRGPLRSGGSVLRFNRAVYRALVAEPVDVVHCFNLDAIVAVFLAARRRGSKAVLDLCEPEYYALWKARYRPLLPLVNAVERNLARTFDQVFVHNRYQVRKFERYGVKSLAQVGSYPNRHMIARAPAGSGTGRFVIGRLGTIYEDNGIEEILEAYRLLLERERARGGPPRYHLYLAGRVFDSYRATFERLIAPLGDQVTVEGSFDAFDMARLYAKLDLSLVLARRTRWFRNITPTKVFDSMVCGVPVVASDIGEVKEILAEAGWGLTVDERSPSSICEAIETISLTPGLRDRMAQDAVRLAHDKYTWEVGEPVFMADYARLAPAAPRPRPDAEASGGPLAALAARADADDTPLERWTRT